MNNFHTDPYIQLITHLICSFVEFMLNASGMKILVKIGNCKDERKEQRGECVYGMMTDAAANDCLSFRVHAHRAQRPPLVSLHLLLHDWLML